jgi:hypothetical protein
MYMYPYNCYDYMGTLFVSSNLFPNSVFALLAHKDLVFFGMVRRNWWDGVVEEKDSA